MSDEKKRQHSSKWRLVPSVVLTVLSVGFYTVAFRPNGVKIVADPEPGHSLGTIKSVYLNTLETSNLAEKWQKKYSGEAQLAGTNLGMVNWTKNKFTEFGLDAWVDNYTTWINYPESTAVHLLGSSGTIYTPTLKEDPVDEYSTNFSVPAFLGYSAGGNVTAQYVYCNFGTKEDFDKLVELGVPLEGKIAVVRYYGNLRGMKVKFAQEHGMIGALLYSDPAEDGNVIEQNGYKAYPDGPARQPSAIQRGSLLVWSEYPGDPRTPGYAIKPGENKAAGDDPHISTPKIPAIPISARDVAPILAKLNGYGPSSNQTGFAPGLIKGFDYSVGPNPAYELNLDDKEDFTVGTMHNIMGQIEGYNKDEVIIIGNHHDSWTYDGGDPHSGTSSLLEMIRAFNELQKIGWKPQRTIVFATWDGEEYGLTGSTEFGEYWAGKLKKTVIAYLNLDVSVSGPNLSGGSSPLLYSVFKESAKELQYNSTTSLYEHFMAVSGGGLSNLGSGSDFSVFIDHLGIPALSTSFSNSADSPVYHYHSMYDNYEWMSKFGDPGFKYHNLMSRFLGLIVLNLSETKVIPFTLSPYSAKLQEFFTTVTGEVPSEWLTSSAFGMCKMDGVTVSDLIADIEGKLVKLAEKTADFDSYTAGLLESYSQWDDLSYWQKLKLTFSIHRVNMALKYYERRFLKEDGLKDRTWMKHVVFAPGRYFGYDCQPLPAMTEALEDDEFDDFLSNLKYFDKLVDRL